MSNIDNAVFGDSVEATVTRNAGNVEKVSVDGVYTAQCYDAAGNLKWSDVIENLTTNVGRASLNDAYLGNTAAGAIVMGLKGTGTADYADTQASHATWLEVGGTNAPTYSGTRKTPTFSASTTANPAVKATSTAGSGTVAGAFINVGGSATIDNTTGVLFSAGDFTAGSKTVTAGDTINVSYQISAAG